jgi:UMF1 family MFS transporter
LTAEPRPRARGIAAWCLFDWANSAFNTVIGTFVFSVYFARGIWGEETEGSAVWGYAVGLSGLGVALLAPVLGAIADRAGRRKPWLAAFTVLTALPTALLWWAYPDRAYAAYALVLVVLASIAFELAGVFYNAMLPAIAPRGMLGRISGWGWGLGYAGGLASLALCLALFVQPAEPWLVGREEAANIRAVAPLAAVWFVLFSLPLFLLTPDEPASGIGTAQAVRQGLQSLRRTLARLPAYGNILRFLLASALWRDGLATLFAVGGLYAAGTFGMSFEEILLFAIGLNVTAGLGAAGFAWLDDGIGSRRTVLIALCGLIVFGVALLLVEAIGTFIALALMLGIFVGPAQAASRTLMARLAPPEMETEMFGLYALAGKAVSFIGPTAFALATQLSGSQRGGMAMIIALFVLGGALLLFVREPGVSDGSAGSR